MSTSDSIFQQRDSSRSALEGQDGEQAGKFTCLLCYWERHLAEFYRFGVVDRLLATPKRVRVAH